MRRLQAAACAVLLCIYVAACGDDASATNKSPIQGHDTGVPVGDDDAGAGNVCAHAKDGTPCGTDHHCIEQLCLYNTCGDGIKAGDEQCDDGNEAIGDGCNPDCRLVPQRCGDAEVQKGEECDDGNYYDLDACSNACTKNLCGNQRIDGVEECDDGNLVNDDACSNACTENRCRNGRVDPGEQCDDGNQINTDQCSNACKIKICGNAKVEGNEECDDGNSMNDDACSNVCTANMCGNQRVDPGEVCDGAALTYGCAPDCSAKITDVCRPCEDAHCSTYMMGAIDLVAGCFLGNPDPNLVPIADPMFAQNCIDSVSCARTHNCGFDPNGYAVSCYCGTRSVDDCNSMGPASDAPCVHEWLAATRESTPALVLSAIADVSVPAGWATFMLECDYEQCKSECVP